LRHHHHPRLRSLKSLRWLLEPAEAPPTRALNPMKIIAVRRPTGNLADNSGRLIVLAPLSALK
jgi:hypothetical protein